MVSTVQVLKLFPIRNEFNMSNQNWRKLISAHIKPVQVASSNIIEERIREIKAEQTLQYFEELMEQSAAVPDELLDDLSDLFPVLH